MGDDDTFALTDAEAGMRFDRVVARLVSVSRSEARSLVETGAGDSRWETGSSVGAGRRGITHQHFCSTR